MGSVVMKVLGRISVSVLVALLTICICYGEAWGVFDEATAVAHFAKGVSYQEKGQRDKAIAEYNKAIEINPRHAQPYANRGYAYAAIGKYDQAITDYNKALEINPIYAKAYANRGYAYRSKGEYEKAMGDFRKAEGFGYQVNPGFFMTLREALRNIRKTDFPLETLVPILLVGLAIFITLILIGKVVTLYQMKSRETLETAAREMGLEYGQAAFIDKVCYEAGFSLFSKGGPITRQVTNCMYGKYEDAGVAIFNYSYAEGGGRHRTTYRHTVVLFSSEVSLFPYLKIRPKGVPTSLVSFAMPGVNFDDLDLYISPPRGSELHEDFKRKYIFEGSDMAQIQHLFTDDVMECFSKHSGLLVEACGNQMIVYVEERVDFKSLLDKAKEFYEVFRKGESN